MVSSKNYNMKGEAENRTTICSKRGIIKLFFQKLGIPVRDVNRIEEGDPFLIAGEAEGLLHEGRPLGFDRLSRQSHTGLMRSSASLATITFMAGTDDVFPGRDTALRTRNDVVEVKLLSGKPAATVLAGAFISGVDVVPAEANLSFGHPIVTYQQDDPWNPDYAIDQTDGFVMDRDGEVAPTVEIKSLILLVNGSGDSLVQQNKGPTNRGDVDG